MHFEKKENIFTNFLVNLKYISDIWGYVKETALYVWVFSSLDAPILYLLIDMVPSFLCVEGRCASCSLMNKVIRCSWMLDVIRNSPDFSLTGFLMMTRAAECHGVLGHWWKLLCCLRRRFGLDEYVGSYCYSYDINVDHSPGILVKS